MFFKKKSGLKFDESLEKNMFRGISEERARNNPDRKTNPDHEHIIYPDPEKSAFDEFFAKISEGLKEGRVLLAASVLNGDKLDHHVFYGKNFKQDDIMKSIHEWKQQAYDKITNDNRIKEESRKINPAKVDVWEKE